MKEKILNIIYQNSTTDGHGIHITFKQLESIVELLCLEKKEDELRRKVQLGYQYMKDNGISFGNAYADEMAVNMFIAGMSSNEMTLEDAIKTYGKNP